MSTWMMSNFQDASSPNMENLIFFHDNSMTLIILIILMILTNMIYFKMNKSYFMKLMDNQILEFTWTMFPMLILLTMSIPSIMNLYLNEEMNNPFITIKAIAHQWYWKFEYSDFNNTYFESFMLKNMNKMNFNFLDSDNRMMIPYNFNIRLITTSMDVIHSFSIPSLGMKIDAIPGRLNQMNMICLRPSIYFGQCSEICGSNHSFMPISLEVTNLNKFLNFIQFK